MSSADEAALEAHVADWLGAHGGYQQVKVHGADFDATRGMDLVDLHSFIAIAQPAMQPATYEPSGPSPLEC